MALGSRGPRVGPLPAEIKVSGFLSRLNQGELEMKTKSVKSAHIDGYWSRSLEYKIVK